MSAESRSFLRSEDWWSVWIGLAVFFLALGPLGGADMLGWGAKFNVWTSASRAITAASPAYSSLSGGAALFFTYAFMLALATIGAFFLGANLKKFVLGFSVIFACSALCYFLGHNGYIAATPDGRKALGLAWSMNLTGEAGYILALLMGLAAGNFFPRAASWLEEATRPE